MKELTINVFSFVGAIIFVLSCIWLLSIIIVRHREIYGFFYEIVGSYLDYRWYRKLRRYDMIEFWYDGGKKYELLKDHDDDRYFYYLDRWDERCRLSPMRRRTTTKIHPPERNGPW